MSSRHSRIGLSLFGLYLLLYGGFVLLAAFSPSTMERLPLAGVNLAIWYGFGLILAAIVLAFVYGWACRSGAASEIPNGGELGRADGGGVRRGRDDPARSGGGDV